MERQSFVRYQGAILLVLGLLAFSVPVSAAAPAEQKRPVFVSHTGEDAVGVSFVQATMDDLGRSQMCSYTGNPDAAEVVLFVSTMDANRDKPGLLTTVSWTLVYMKDATKVYIGSGLMLADRVQVPKSAAALVARVDGLLKVRKAELPGSDEWQRYVANWNEAVDRVAETLPEDACGIKVRSAFREELRVCLRWSMAANLTFNVEDIIKTVAADYVTDAEFAQKLQSQNAKLSQCQSDLAALKKSLPASKK